jgi:hypothetical protein
MCDYSLHQVSSRPARVGESLVSTRFISSVTHGFAAVNEPNVAICLLPGTEVAFEREIEFDQSWSFFHKQKSAGTVARFRQVNMDKPNTHHDALELADGRIVLVHSLREGQYATVLQLPAANHPASDVPGDDAVPSRGEAAVDDLR